MDAPFESLAPNIQARLKSIERSIAACSSIEQSLNVAGLLQKFYIGKLASTWLGRLFIEKDIGDAERFALDFFLRDEEWINQATKTLYQEGLVTAREAIAAQLESAFGKVLPEDFVFSQAQKRAIWDRARASAESIATTFNKRIPVWIQEIKQQWIFQHGSLRGLNRWNIISRLGRPIYDWNKHRDQLISVTEFSHTWAIAVDDFWTANEEGLELEFLLSPSTASDPMLDSDPVCAGYAGQWLTREEIEMFPAHVACVHYNSETRIKGGAIPPYIQIGHYGYSLDGLSSI